jgi:hypothetical protein
MARIRGGDHLDDDLHAQIKALKAVCVRCVASPRLTQYDDYLSAIYDAYVEILALSKASQKRARIILFGLGPKSRKRQHLVRLLIDATCDPRVDSKIRSRWTLALRYARTKRRFWSGRAGDFIRKRGGPSGCEQRYAKVNEAADEGW